jgi:hypothetical protein
MVGVLMLISIFVVAAGILAVFYFSTPPPSKSLAVNIIVTNASRSVMLYHGGGDTLSGNNLQIYVDGTLQSFSGLGSDNIWTPGETLSYTASNSDPIPSRVDIAYNGSQASGSSPVLLAALHLGNTTSVKMDG